MQLCRRHVCACRPAYWHSYCSSRRNGRHKAHIFIEMPKPLDVHKSVPHSLSQYMSQPGLMPDLSCALQELAQLLYQLKIGGRKALESTQISKALVTHKRVPHRLNQHLSHPCFASLAMLTAGAGTAAVSSENTRTQGSHLHSDDKEAGYVQEHASQLVSAHVTSRTLARFEMCTAGAGTAAIPAEDWRAQGSHLHPDDQDVRCAGGLPQPARLHIPAPGWHHQA